MEREPEQVTEHEFAELLERAINLAHRCRSDTPGSYEDGYTHGYADALLGISAASQPITEGCQPSGSPAEIIPPSGRSSAAKPT